MRMARSATSIIWRTVVAAGAMLAVPGCPSGGGGMRTVCDPPEETFPAEPREPAPEEVVSAGEPVTIGEATITVTVQTNPPGADVFVNGEAQGQTPAQIVVPAADGEMVITITHEGYAEEARVVRADHDQELAVTLAEAVAARPRCYQVGERGRGFILS